VKNSEFERFWKLISEMGGSYENANDRLVAVDLPPDADVSQIYKVFEAGEQDGVWAFEEAHFSPRRN